MRVKKIYKSIALAGLASVMSLGVVATSQAASSYVDILADSGALAPGAMDIVSTDVAGTSAGAVTLAETLVKAGDYPVDMGGSAAWSDTSSGDRAIAYTCPVALNNATVLEFTLTNGAIAPDTTMYLMAWNADSAGADSAGGAAPGWVQVGALNDFTADPITGNYTAVSFEINTDSSAGHDYLLYYEVSPADYRPGEVSPADDRLGPVIVESGNPLPGDTMLVLSLDGVTTNTPLVIVADEDRKVASSVTINVTNAQSAAGTILEAPKSVNAENVVTIVGPLTASVNFATGTTLVPGPATSVIDVDAATSRSSFAEEGGTGADVLTNSAEDTDLDFSVAAIIVDEESIANIGVDLTTTSYTMTIAQEDAAYSGVASVSVNGELATFATDHYNYSSSFTLNNLTLTDMGSDLGTIAIEPDFANPLAEGDWNVTLAITPAALDPITLLNEATSHIWSVNAMQCKVPYVALGYPGFVSFLKVTNENDLNAAELFVDAVIENYSLDEADPLRHQVVTNASLTHTNGETEIGANRIVTVGEGDMRTAFGLNKTDQVHIEMTIYAQGPQNDIHVTGFTKDLNGRTVLDVLYNTNNAGDGRIWQ